MRKFGISLICSILITAMLFNGSYAMAKTDDDSFIIETPTVEPTYEEPIENNDDGLYDGFIIDDQNPITTQPQDPNRPQITNFSMPSDVVLGNESVNINFSLNMSGQLFLTLFANDMRRIGAISTKNFESGKQTISWDGKIDGKVVSAGDYIIHASLKVNGQYSTTVEHSIHIEVIIPTLNLKSAQSSYTIGQKTNWTSVINTNQAGKLSATLVSPDGSTFVFYDKPCNPGDITVEWDGKQLGKAVSAGKYSISFKLTGNTGITHEVSTSVDVKSTTAEATAPPATGTSNHTSPIIVLARDEKTQTEVKSKPGGGTVLGKIYGSTVGVTVHEYSGNFALISGRDYDSNKLIKGYVPKGFLKTITPKPGYVVVIDKKIQRLLVYKDGKLFKTMKCSTGLEMETPNGEFVTGGRLAGFESHGLWVRYATRFNGSIYYHEIPSKDGVFTKYEKQLGTKASAGCVRVPQGEAKWLYDNIPKGSKVIVQ